MFPIRIKIISGEKNHLSISNVEINSSKKETAWKFYI